MLLFTLSIGRVALVPQYINTSPSKTSTPTSLFLLAENTRGGREAGKERGGEVEGSRKLAEPAGDVRGIYV